eukprot:gb/GEZN01016378.1/.p1 GENE.gb/GEZN01016378.1/~~gb/GEZN01016378.1/.p1  ORF type:complete len:183 (-),score=7.02 gb/GEZN01016378.1/:267-815(-)
MGDVCLASVTLVSNIIAMSASWVQYQAASNEGMQCTSITSVNLWLGACRRMICPTGTTYNCFRFLIDEVPSYWEVTQAFVCLALILSIFGCVFACGTCDTKGSKGRKSLTMLWVATAVCGIVAMSVWTDSYSPGTNTGVFFTLTNIYGGGYIMCIVGWIFALFTAAATYTGLLDTDEFNTGW